MNKKDTPIILTPANSINDLERLKKSVHVWSHNDIYEQQSREIFEISHPNLIGKTLYENECHAFIKNRLANQNETIAGSWIYFPWNGRLIHMVSQDEYLALRTNRNRNLITEEEQGRLMNFCVAIVGLSVGSNIATALSYAGISNKMKLAEFDTLETTNLNRIKARTDQIGMKKIDVVSQQIYEANPFAELTLLNAGITKETLNSFVAREPLPNLIFEIIDSFEMKIHLRSLARDHGIPVVMITNLGDKILIDVERYDLDKKNDFFNGRAGNIPEEILRNPDIDSQDKHKYAVQLAGIKNIPKRALQSVSEIGNTLVGRPQLVSTVTIAAGISTYVARKIALGEALPSCSWLINLDDIFQKESTFCIS